MEEAELVAGSVTGVPRGTLRVTAPSWAATRGMLDMVAAYRQRYPEVVVDLSFEDRFVDLIEEGYDLAIRATADQPPATLIARPCARCRSSSRALRNICSAAVFRNLPRISPNTTAS